MPSRMGRRSAIYHHHFRSSFTINTHLTSPFFKHQIMKSLKDYSLNISEQEYHDLDAWSYSTIAKYARNGFSAIATLHDKLKPTPEMEFGSLFDSFITKGKQTLNDYAVADFSVPPAEKGVLDFLATSCTLTHFDEVPMNDVINAAETARYQPNWKPYTRYDKIAKYADYYDTIKSGKKLVSKADWEDAMAMYKVFREDEYLKGIFGTKNTKDVEYLYQVQFCVPWVIEGETVNVKCMFDLLVVDHKKKEILPVDLKTSSMPAYDFAEHFVKMRYDIQSQLYSDVLKKTIDGIPEYYDYLVLPFLYTDVSRTDMVPVTYAYDPSFGLSFTKGEKTYNYKGWEELLAEILVYEANDAKVPNFITTAGPNDLIDVLER